jgi:serine/threonine-protein kinase
MKPHPNVVTVFDIGSEAGRPFVVSEYLSGGDLEAELARGPVSVERTKEIARALLSGLIAAHGSGIVHRDLKPANVWLDDTGNPKIGDFGVALVADRARATITGVVTATVEYAAPEQLMNQPVDGRTDLYSLGCLLYQLLTGRTPFVGSMTAQVTQHLHAQPQPPSAHNPSIPPALDRFVLRLLAKRPGDRPADASAALAELEAFSP